MPDPFHVAEIRTPEGPVVIRVQGHLDSKSTPQLLDHCQRVLGQGKSLVLNLQQVTFIASNGVGGLLSLIDEFKAEGLSIRLADLSMAVESVLKLLNLDQYLAIDPTESAAISALEG